MRYVKRSFSAISRALGHSYADGGKMNGERPVSQSPARHFGVTEFDAGGSHEENRYGGIPQGIAPDGSPNLVEEGEVKLGSILGKDNQYVLSNRIILDGEHAEEFGIPQSVVGETFASAFKMLTKGLKERGGSAEVKNEMAHLANAFMEAQDAMKAEQEARMAASVMNSLPPETKERMAQEAAQAMQQQQQQTQIAAQQDGVAQQGVPPETMGGGAPQQAFPPEAMGGDNAMEPTDMAGGVMPPEAMGGEPIMANGQPMMARGGRINKFLKGGNMRNMFNGIFTHRFEKGGLMSNRNASPSEYAQNSRYAQRKENTKSTDKLARDAKANESRNREPNRYVSPSEHAQNSKYAQRNENTKSIDDLAREVIRGKLGYGKQRREILGDKYDAVQKRVNELLSKNRNSSKPKRDEPLRQEPPKGYDEPIQPKKAEALPVKDLRLPYSQDEQQNDMDMSLMDEEEGPMYKSLLRKLRKDLELDRLRPSGERGASRDVVPGSEEMDEILRMQGMTKRYYDGL